MIGHRVRDGLAPYRTLLTSGTLTAHLHQIWHFGSSALEPTSNWHDVDVALFLRDRVRVDDVARILRCLLPASEVQRADSYTHPTREVLHIVLVPSDFNDHASIIRSILGGHLVWSAHA